MKKRVTVLTFGGLVVCSIFVIGIQWLFTKNTTYSAVDTVVSGETYNSDFYTSTFSKFWLDGDQIYYCWDGFYNMHLFASGEKGRRHLISDRMLTEGKLVGELQAYDGVVYFPAKTDTGDCIFFCYYEKDNELKEVARVKANLGPWAVIGQTLIYSDYGDAYTGNYTLYSLDLISETTEVISSFVCGFSVKNDTICFLTEFGDKYTIYEYNILNHQKDFHDAFQYRKNGVVIGMTNQTIIMNIDDTTDTNILIYNIAQKNMDAYTLPWKVGCFSVYEKYAFLSFYYDENGIMKEINGLYRLDLQNGNLQLINEEICMPKTIFPINDHCGYITTHESKFISTKTVVYRFSLEDSSMKKVYSW